MMSKYFFAWFPMVFIAIINGTIREVVYKTFTGDLTAHQISTVTGIALFAIYMWIIFRKWKLGSAKQAILVGLMWLSMTVCFEFIFGHYVMGNPWEKLLHDYNILQGRLWSLVLIFTLTAPYLFYKKDNKVQAK